MGMAQIFVGKIFVHRLQPTKSTKRLPLENYPLYGILLSTHTSVTQKNLHMCILGSVRSMLIRHHQGTYIHVAYSLIQVGGKEVSSFTSYYQHTHTHTSYFSLRENYALSFIHAIIRYVSGNVVLPVSVGFIHVPCGISWCLWETVS